MGFVCESPSVLLEKLELILRGKLVHSSKNSVLCKTPDYGLRILYRKSWVAGKLRKYNVNEQFVDMKLLELIAGTEEGGRFYCRAEGIHLKSRLLESAADETEVVQDVTAVLMGGRREMKVGEVFSTLPKEIRSGRFLSDVSNLVNFFDFHCERFCYRSSDNVAIRSEFLAKAKAVEKLHSLMRECGAGQSRDMTLKALFKVWTAEQEACGLEIEDVQGLKRVLKEHGARFCFKDSDVVGLMVPGEEANRKKPVPERERVKLRDVVSEIEAAAQKGKDGKVALQRVMELLSDKSKRVVIGEDELKMLLNLNCCTFKFASSSTIELVKSGAAAKVDVTKDAALCVVLETIVKAYGCDDKMSLKSAWTHLKTSGDATFMNGLKSVEDLMEFVKRHGDRFRSDGQSIETIEAKGKAVASKSKKQPEAAAASAAAKGGPKLVVSTTKKQRLDRKDVDTIMELMRSGKHTTSNSALSYFNFDDKSCKEKKVYFKMSWVWQKLEAKLKNHSIRSSLDLLNVLLSCHKDEFAVFRSKEGADSSLVHSREVFSRLPTERFAVDKVGQAINSLGGTCDVERLWQRLPPNVQARIQGKSFMKNFFAFHPKEFDCALKP